MSASIPTTEPTSLVAGETVKWHRSLADYPVSELWTLTYAIRGASSLDVTCTVSGSYYLATISAIDSGNLAAGRYWWQAYVSKASTGERYLVDNGSLKVTADLADAVAGYDGRSHAQIVLDAIEALIQGKASKDQLNVTIGNTTVGRMSPEQIERWRDVYRREVATDQRAERIRRGLPTGRYIGTRFNR